MCFFTFPPELKRNNVFGSESGSEVTEKCTKKKDTKCRCRKGFVPVESDSATCECGIGFGLHYGGKGGSKA